MLMDNPPSIADRSRQAGRVAAVVLVGAVCLGTIAAVHYARLDLTLSHYDARGHLTVARRITDSLTPGWRQIGAVWLPLPHLLDLPLVQSDWAYRTGYPAVALSILSLALGLAALAAYLVRRTGSAAAAVAAPALILANPNLLYLQSTPMTEPLLLGLAFISLWAIDRWMEQPSASRRRVAGTALVALMLTRYEGWCMAAGLVTVSAAMMWRQGARRAALGLVPYAVGAVLGFLWLSQASTGMLFVTGGFFVPDPTLYHAVSVALYSVVTGARDLGGVAVVLVAAVGAAVTLVALLKLRPEALPLSLAATVLLPAYAFYDGHPFRVRYMVPIVAVSAVLAVVALARLPRRWQAPALAALALVAMIERPPFDPQAPMVLEAQWETPFRLQRVAVTATLRALHDGTPILASMGSLGHYMQETSRAGFHLADFVHEGNGDLWLAALSAPNRYVHWILLEERAEGGDVLAARARQDPSFLAGFSRVAEGGGLALYRRTCAGWGAPCASPASPPVP
jgi:hypothetical protein